MKSYLIILAMCVTALLIPQDSLSDTLILSSGKEIQGSIIHISDESVEIDIGLEDPLTYYLDEIQEVIEEEDVLPDQEKAAEGGAFLWQVEGSANTVYLLGSIHMGSEDMYPLPEVIERAFISSSVLGLEIDAGSINKAESVKFLSFVMLPKGEKLKDHLAPQTFTRLVSLYQKYGLDIGQVQLFQPWFAIMMLAKEHLKNLGFEQTLGIDNYFLEKAQGEKEVVELESISDQMSALNAIKDYGLYLDYSMLEMSRLGEMMDIMVSYWKKGDIQGMTDLLIRDPLREYPEQGPMYEELFFKRNTRIAGKIEGFLKSAETYFVIVGAGHLIGDRGIISILEEKGFSAKQL